MLMNTSYSATYKITPSVSLHRLFENIGFVSGMKDQDLWRGLRTHHEGLININIYFKWIYFDNHEDT